MATNANYAMLISVNYTELWQLMSMMLVINGSYTMVIYVYYTMVINGDYT